MTIPAFLGKPVRYVDFKMGDPSSSMWQFLIEGLGLMDQRGPSPAPTRR